MCINVWPLNTRLQQYNKGGWHYRALNALLNNILTESNSKKFTSEINILKDSAVKFCKGKDFQNSGVKWGEAWYFDTQNGRDGGEMGQKPNINYERGHKHEPDFANRKAKGLKSL